MNIKDFPVRITKKGKTRGRPSKAEIHASKLASWLWEKNKDKMNAVLEDMFMYGTGISQIKNGKFKHIKYFDFIDKDKIYKRP